MKILITGVAGFLGSHLSENLFKMGHEIIGVDNMIGGYDDNGCEMPGACIPAKGKFTSCSIQA